MYKLINLKRLNKDLNNIFIKKNININKIILIIGPCSLSNIKDFYLYFNFINFIIFKNITIIIRVYYEKPRTNIGWKGYIYDPFIDESYSILDGIYIIRKLLINISKKTFLAIECLNFYLSNYFINFINWLCIGARTMQSQLHREYCSGLKCIIGIKNDTSSIFKNLFDSYLSIKNSHFYVDFFNNKKIIFTKGNNNCHFVLRGGKLPNYSIFYTKKIYFPIIIDCSHSNSLKNAINQIFVFENVYNQIKFLNKNIKGFMIESYLFFGNQNIKNKFKGISITDSCLNLKLTLYLLKIINDI